jgi:hypothetical protein
MELGATASTASESTVSGSSFYAAMRVLPADQRHAMFEIYSFCRAVDDIADGRGDRQARLAELARWRSDIDALFAGASPRRVRALGEAIRVFELQREDFLDHRRHGDGRQADIRAPDLATLIRMWQSGSRARWVAFDPRVPHARPGWHVARLPPGPGASTHQHPARSRRGCRDRAGSICRAKLFSQQGSARSTRRRFSITRVDHGLRSYRGPCARPLCRGSPDHGGHPYASCVRRA